MPRAHPNRRRPEVDVRIDQQRFARHLGMYLRGRMGVITGKLVKATQRKISRTQPVRVMPSGRVVGLNPSRPGTPPKRLTGQLYRSIDGAVWSTRSGGWPIVHGRYGVLMGVPYALALEFGRPAGPNNQPPPMEPRPYLRPVLHEKQKSILRWLRSNR